MDTGATRGSRRAPSPRIIAPGSLPSDVIRKPPGARPLMPSRRILPPQGLREINQHLGSQSMRIIATFIDDDAPDEDEGRHSRSSQGNSRSSSVIGEAVGGHNFSVGRSSPASQHLKGGSPSPYGSGPQGMRSRIGAMSTSPSPRMSPMYMHPQPQKLSPLQRGTGPSWRQPPSWPTSARPSSRQSAEQQQQAAMESAVRKRRIMAALYKHAYESNPQVERVVLPAGGSHTKGSSEAAGAGNGGAGGGGSGGGAGGPVADSEPTQRPSIVDDPATIQRPSIGSYQTLTSKESSSVAPLVGVGEDAAD